MQPYLDVHENAERDLLELEKVDIEAAATILVVLEELKADPRIIDKLTTGGTNDTESMRLGIKRWESMWRRGTDLWRFRVFDTPATVYRVIYGYNWRTQCFCILAVVRKEDLIMTILAAILSKESLTTGDPYSPTSSSGDIIHAEFLSPRPLPTPNTTPLDVLISKLESRPDMAAAMLRARKYLAITLYANESSTLTALRLSAGLSQTRLAQSMGTSQSHVARIEGGQTDPGTDVIAKMALALGVDEHKAFQAVRHQRSRKEKIE